MNEQHCPQSQPHSSEASTLVKIADLLGVPVEKVFSQVKQLHHRYGDAVWPGRHVLPCFCGDTNQLVRGALGAGPNEPVFTAAARLKRQTEIDSARIQALEARRAGLREQANAWFAVFSALQAVVPGFSDPHDQRTGMELAVDAVATLVKQRDEALAALAEERDALRCDETVDAAHAAVEDANRERDELEVKFKVARARDGTWPSSSTGIYETTGPRKSPARRSRSFWSASSLTTGKRGPTFRM